MTSLSELRFFATPAHDCSYLEGREAITLFADPLANIDKRLYSSLSAVGFRRSGTHIYRPYCQSCSACIPVRVQADRFVMSRSQRRVWRRNQDLTVTLSPPQLTDELFSLYDRYIDDRHRNGDMYPASREQFESFLVEGRPEACFVEFRAGSRLVAVAVIDELDHGLSAIYTFFDPALARRSLGVFAILWLVDRAARQKLSHVYLGYWIKQCQKMNYKMDYRPIEMFVNNRWIEAEP